MKILACLEPCRVLNSWKLLEEVNNTEKQNLAGDGAARATPGNVLGVSVHSIRTFDFAARPSISSKNARHSIVFIPWQTPSQVCAQTWGRGVRAFALQLNSAHTLEIAILNCTNIGRGDLNLHPTPSTQINKTQKITVKLRQRAAFLLYRPTM